MNLKKFEYGNQYAFTYDNKINTKEKPIETLQYFLRKGTKKEIEFFKENLEILSETKPYRIFEICEEKIERPLPLIRKLAIGNHYKKNLKNIQKICR